MFLIFLKMSVIFTAFGETAEDVLRNFSTQLLADEVLICGLKGACKFIVNFYSIIRYNS